MLVQQIIDRSEPMSVFHSLITKKDGRKLFWLVGDPKMGKSRLLQEFKRIASNEKFIVAMVDLRSKLLSYEDILSSITEQFDRINFKNYEDARNEYLTHSEIKISQVKQFFSMMRVENNSANKEDYYKKKLSTTFAKDLRMALPNSGPLIILFDSFEQAEDRIQE